MNWNAPFLKTRLLLGTALTLSCAALLSVVAKPSPLTYAAPFALVGADGVRVEARSSHPVVAPSGTEFFTEYTVTLQDGIAPASEQVAIAVVLDRSGSMSGNKLDDAKRAVHRLVDLMRDGDEFALVTFGSDVLEAPLRRIDGPAREQLHRDIDAVVATGGTNISAGLQAGQQALSTATGARRLILVSDGQPTEGLIDSMRLAESVGFLHANRITVTALGVGSDYDGALLSLLSERGGGMLGHLQNVALLEEVLGKELTAARQAVARNVELRFNPRGAQLLDAPGRHVFWEGSTQVLHLADLRPNVPTRVVLSFRSSSSSDVNALFVDAQLRWTSVGGESHSGDTSLAVAVVDDVDEVNRSRDEPVFARGVSAVGAVRMLAAASAYERGDDRLGSSLLDQARAAFGMSADALAGTTEVDSFRTNVNKAGASERKRMNYGLEKKTLSNFGRENEGY